MRRRHFLHNGGGETSSVIGAILAALDQWGTMDERRQKEAGRHLYFVYNNPDEVLRPFARSVSVLDNPAITRVNLATGPQAIAGSTRLQATTIETFVLGAVLEEALFRILRAHLTARELRDIGFGQGTTLLDRLSSFRRIKAAVDAAVPDMARLTSTRDPNLCRLSLCHLFRQCRSHNGIHRQHGKKSDLQAISSRPGR